MPMQARFDFCGRDEVSRWRVALAPFRTRVELLPRRRPIGQLVKSMISGRTRDAVSQAAYDRLVATFPLPGRLAAAEPREVLARIRDVTFAEDKAMHVVATLQRIARERGGFALDFLGALPLDDAIAWLERLPGVGRKVAASTLNASTLDLPVFIVDSHVLRVLQRLGFVGAQAPPRAASEALTATMAEWRGRDFLDFHVALKRLGQTCCRPEAPACAACPLARECPSRR